MKTNLSGELSYEFIPKTHPVAEPRHAQRTFKGYRRTDDQVGVRNMAHVQRLFKRVAIVGHSAISLNKPRVKI